MIYVMIQLAKKPFGFVFSRSDAPIVIGVCGMRLADQDHKIISDPIAIRSFLESGPYIWRAANEAALNALNAISQISSC